MRRLFVLAVMPFAMVLATSAQATWFNGSISYGLSTLTPLVATGVASGGTSTVAPNLITLPSQPFVATGPVLITLDPTAAAPLTGQEIQLTAPVNCTLTGTPIGGSCPLGGTANALVGYAPFLIVPLSGIGVAGRHTFGPYGSWIDAQPWIAATATATIAGSPLLTDNGAPHRTVGYDNRAVDGTGVVKLVAPAGLMSTLAGDLPIYVHMTLDFHWGGTTTTTTTAAATTTAGPWTTTTTTAVGTTTTAAATTTTAAWPITTTSHTPTTTTTTTLPPCDLVTTLEVGSPGIPLRGLGDVTVTTTEALTVGSTDVVVNFEPTVLRAVSANSTLGSFTFSIDNELGTVITASASGAGDEFVGGDPLLTVRFTPAPGVMPGTDTMVTLSDADLYSCNDLAGPVPPIPPVSLPYDQVPGEPFIWALGDVDCDRVPTAIDASVVLGLFVGSVTDGDLPPACSDPANRLAVSDWDLNGALSPIDASVTLGFFVGLIDPFCDTPLGIWLGLCPSGAAMQSSAIAAASSERGTAMESSSSEAAPSEAHLLVGSAVARRGQEVTLAVTTREALEIGSSGLSLSYDASALEVVVVESELDGFVNGIDEAEGVIPSASASLGQELLAGDALMSVVFRVKSDAGLGEHIVSVSGELGGPVLEGQIPEPITVVAEPGFVSVRQSGGSRRCGLGVELALLLPSLMWLWRRRRI